MNETAPPPAPVTATFEQAVLPHRDAAFNLAKWLLRHDHDAEDCVQESFLRAYHAFSRFRGEDGKSWLLAIVRNFCYSRLRQQRRHEPPVLFDEAMHGDTVDAGESPWGNSLARELLPRAMEQLPTEAREVLVLHEIEGLPYREIATIAEIPLGTVMSRLARARQKLQQELMQLIRKEQPNGLQR